MVNVCSPTGPIDQPQAILQSVSPSHHGTLRQAGHSAAAGAFQAINHWLPRFDVLVIGPGLGRDPWVHDTVVQATALPQNQIPACFCRTPFQLRMEWPGPLLFTAPAASDHNSFDGCCKSPKVTAEHGAQLILDESGIGPVSRRR